MASWRERAHAPVTGQVLGPLSEIGPGGKEYCLGRGIGAFRCFVLRLGDGGLRAYVNQCPHYSLPLNCRPDEFLTRQGDRIMCRQHLALFDLDSGACLEGACEGEGLQAIPVIARDGMVVVG
jgi:nitrite reductase/ring-hydroxylating ferredoxin subunit